MPNRQETGILKRGASIANTVSGAVKMGKAVAGIAKGAAAGGPYGAIIGAIWANRKTVGKILLVAAVLLMLPILFILMLPSIIFGGLTASADTPILNNDAAIIENLKTAEHIIEDVLQQSHQRVLEQINDEISNLSPDDSATITDAYAENIPFNAILILSQYSASKDYSEIDMGDLKNTVASGKNHLFSYTVTEGALSEDSAGTLYHYTVVYSGEEYFANNIFKLSEEQRKLANEYAQNLMLYLYGSNYGGSGEGTGANVSEAVLQYAELIHKYADTYGISEYFDLICAVMMAESNGLGLDPMQSSECPYNTKFPNEPNAIQDPEYSIDCGVHYLSDCLKSAGCKSPIDTAGLSLALQGYNFGNGYIGWALEKYGGYTEANAVEFSQKMQAQLGWTSYGNPHYVKAVMKYYRFPAQGGADGWGSPFVGRNWRVAVTSEFGARIDPITGEAGAFHDGLDIGFEEGTPINVVLDGTVSSVVYSNQSYGNHVIVDHGNGIRTLYAHCSALLVTEGQQVQKGDVIALVGHTGRATGPHLHLQIKIDGELQDPRKYIP